MLNPIIMKLRFVRYSIFIGSSFFGLFSCGDGKKNDYNEAAPIILKSNKLRSKNDSTPRSAPIINITDTTAFPYTVICIKDSASNNIRLGQKLAKIYGERLVDIIRKNKLKVVGPPMAWYKSQKAPFFFEAGLPVDRAPKKLTKGISIKQTGGPKAIVAHYFGPYEETVQAYQALKDWLKDENKTSAGAPYEIYISDPIDKHGNPVDPYKVQTDIVFPYR